ncbi:MULTISPECIES: acyl-CoA dehydrogenase family protein [unclassified Variovorax]|jgi:alkylation response protein AidB-like acyl-CoA dehydrogenase|uniref:acyl-CoA dehydrogenase family protein n=1 Tax=unclassified Variovorax TaxID=663243 RepID=UPI00086B92BC|nr:MULTISPECIES: acyl-CoA dehydrogenase family protein [unclassified Variovorax]MBN8755646.1 acyl-CoA/acyl-ACP dehydrogenase [Variovorax sp.]ODU19199.1 MAG: acyl-CoA dehydrogenase [Variovorax sp. SCN 67-85]ODV23368.1 MAG: acyl-CoA dehydrogenase [Variovorax sp. SCN 67-20]OJZ16000.1 MAG: acyl-CoA dehydrogenase [Variovorax sp. 67-131]
MSFYDQYDEHLSGAERALVHRAQAFCAGPFSRSVLDAFDQARAYETSWIQAWADQGFLGLQTLRAHGGFEASYLCKIRVAQAMAEHSFGAAFAINNLQGSVTRVSKTGSAVQHDRLLERMRSGDLLCAPAMSEPSGGSDLSALATSARRVEGGWLVNGTKAWVTNGTVVGCVTLLARVDRPTGGQDIASFLTLLEDSPTVSREEIRVPGGRAFRLARIEFRDHFVPDWCLFSEPGQAFKTSLTSINAARVHVAAMCVASLRAALAEATQYCASREAFGRPVLDHQGLRWELAEVSIRLEAANALVFRAAKAIQDGSPGPALAAQAKKFAVDTCLWGIDQCLRAMGAIGVSAGHRLNMLHAECRMAAFGDGTNEMLLERIGKNLQSDYRLPSAEGGVE